MSISQLHVLRSVLSRGVPYDLVTILLNRCGATLAEWQELLDRGIVVERDRRYVMTDEGKRIYRKEKQGRYF